MANAIITEPEDLTPVTHFPTYYSRRVKANMTQSYLSNMLLNSYVCLIFQSRLHPSSLPFWRSDSDLTNYTWIILLLHIKLTVHVPPNKTQRFVFYYYLHIWSKIYTEKYIYIIQMLSQQSDILHRQCSYYVINTAELYAGFWALHLYQCLCYLDWILEVRFRSGLCRSLSHY